jgi:DNA-binding transcriptional LysR family regulator
VGTRGDLDWNDLKHFLAAARAGTLAGAARGLRVEHSTIGRRLTALEDALGAPLFTRGPGGLALTPLGERIAPLVEDVERAVLAVHEIAATAKTRVRLATPSAFARLLTPHFARFGREHPDVTIELLSGSRMVDLKKGEAELAIRAGASEDGDLVTKGLGDMGWSLYASEAYLAGHAAPADPRALAGHDVLGYEARLAALPGPRWIEQHGAGATVVMRCREVSDVLAACVAGLGLAVLPSLLAEAEPALRRLTPEVLGTQRFSLVYRKEVLRAAPVRAVIRFVTDLMRGFRARMSGQGR